MSRESIVYGSNFRSGDFEGWVVVGVKADCLRDGPRPICGVPSVGVFLRDPSPYLSEFRRKPRKSPNGDFDRFTRFEVS